MKLYIGVSGGVDSMYLLSHLIEYRDVYDITCLCFNHGSDKFSKEACILVKDYCSLHDIKFIQGSMNTEFDKGNLEKLWRVGRYQFFKEHVGTNILLLAHHKTDQYVSWLMSRLKNSSRCFIPVINEYEGMSIIRPLYLKNKSHIKEYIVQNSIPTLEDPYNTKGDRGRTELELIPLVDSVFPHTKGVFRKLYNAYLKKNHLPLYIPSRDIPLNKLMDLLISKCNQGVTTC